jgi:hypothetical protein
VCPEQWTGVLSGAVVCDIKRVHIDPSNGDLAAHAVETLTATDLQDHSTGTLVIDDALTGNIFTGGVFGDGTVVSATGDRTFQCMLGSHIELPQYVNPAGAFGGYVMDRKSPCG